MRDFPKRRSLKPGMARCGTDRKAGTVLPFSRGVPSQKRYAGIFPETPNDLTQPHIECRIARMTVGSLYLPNGNPASGPKFDYKLRWFKRFSRHAKKLLASGWR